MQFGPVRFDSVRVRTRAKLPTMSVAFLVRGGRASTSCLGVMPALVPARLPRRTCRDAAELLGLRPFPAGGLPREVSLAPAYPGYFLVRRKHVRRVLAHRDDDDRRPFYCQYDIRRELRGRSRRWRRFDRRPLLPIPNRDRYGRWQLEVQFAKDGKRYRTPYHRVVGLKLCPCTTDHEGWEVDPFMVQIGGLTDGLYDHFWEVRHDNRDVRDYSVGNLFTPWWEVRQRLPRPR